MATVRPQQAAKREEKVDPNKPLPNIQPGPDDAKPWYIQDESHRTFGFSFRYFHDLIRDDFLQRKMSRIWLAVLKAENHLTQSILGVGRAGRSRDAAYTNQLMTEMPNNPEQPGLPEDPTALAWQTAKLGPVSATAAQTANAHPQNVANQMVQGASDVYGSSQSPAA